MQLKGLGKHRPERKVLADVFLLFSFLEGILGRILNIDKRLSDDLVQRLDNLFAQWEEAIIKCDDAKLESQTPDSNELWWSTLAHLAIHNAYHIGQIVHIRKEQGLWETWED